MGYFIVYNYAPINVKPQKGGGGQTQENLTF